MAATVFPASLCDLDKEPPDELGDEDEVLDVTWDENVEAEDVDKGGLDPEIGEEREVVRAVDVLLGSAVVVDGVDDVDAGELRPP